MSSETNPSANEAQPEAAPSEAPASEAAAPDPLAQAKADLEATREKFLRTAADFDNYRKRARRDVEDAEKRGKESFLRELLPVFDNLERAATHASQSTEAKAVADGVRMVLRQFIDTLERLNVKRVTAVGASFDPNVHEAIGQRETADQPPGTVVDEVQAGYLLGDRLIRAAMVVVAKAPTN